MRIRHRRGRLEMRFRFLKNRLQQGVNQLSDKIGQLKMHSAPTGRNTIAQGNALGMELQEIASPVRAKYGCKGHIAPTGLKFSFTAIPRALSWAITGRPFRAKQSQYCYPLAKLATPTFIGRVA